MTLVLLRWVDVILDVCRQAASTLPLIITLGLAAGRRGNGSFLISANLLALNFCIVLGICGIFHFPAAYLCEVIAFHAPSSDLLAPFFQLSGLPWSSSMAAQICGIPFLFAALNALRKCRISAESYSLAQIKFPILWCLIAAAFFLAGFFLINWPFAGLPPGLDMERAALAILRNAVRHYFMAFCPAGALGLVYALRMLGTTEFGAPERILACRWMSVWAFIGYVPYFLQATAIVVGINIRGNVGGFGPNGLTMHYIALGVLGGAIVLWLYQALSSKIRPVAAVVALGLYITFLLIP